MTRLKMNDNTMRELIGFLARSGFRQLRGSAGDGRLGRQCVAPDAERADPAASGASAHRAQAASTECVPYGSIVAVHRDCVAPGFRSARCGPR